MRDGFTDSDLLQLRTLHIYMYIFTRAARVRLQKLVTAVGRSYTVEHDMSGDAEDYYNTIYIFDRLERHPYYTGAHDVITSYYRTEHVPACVNDIITHGTYRLVPYTTLYVRRVRRLSSSSSSTAHGPRLVITTYIYICILYVIPCTHVL